MNFESNMLYPIINILSKLIQTTHSFQVGGKRRLTVPANMAYGDKGASPEIPPKAMLVFDLECKYVN